MEGNSGSFGFWGSVALRFVAAVTSTVAMAGTAMAAARMKSLLFICVRLVWKEKKDGILRMSSS